MSYTRKTKIICTLGPASSSEEVIRKLIMEGMDVARLNFSHGSYEDKLAIMNNVKKVRTELGRHVGILLDTKGPEIRVGTFKDHAVMLEAGQEFTLTTADIEGDESRVSISYKDIANDIQVGTTILLDDGLIEMRVTSIEGENIVCTVLNGGKVSDRKGVNLPDVNISMPFLSQKDIDDIKFGIEQGVDFIALSFTRTAEDVEEVISILRENGNAQIGLIAKIENNQGVQNLDEIVKVADGVMVARGDMGVEIPLEEVPVIQKMMIKKVVAAGKQVITATQMLDSMINNPRPTRAESTDVANAIYDGTCAIMLSGETAAGKYPVESLKTMAKIAIRAEQAVDYRGKFKERQLSTGNNITNAISHAAVTTAEDLDVAAIVTVTKSGFTAKMLSKHRPSCPIIGCSTDDAVCRRLNLVWGVTPVHALEEKDTEALFSHALDLAIETGKVAAGELTVLTAGIPLGISGTTNLIKVQVAGHVLVKGVGICGGSVTSELCICNSVDDLRRNYTAGDIIVVSESSKEMLPYIKTAAGVITEDKSEDCHAAIVGLTLGIPTIIGASHATQILKKGAVVTMDAKTGIVSSNN